MSDPILPLMRWPEGIAQARVPANDNALRLEALFRPCLGVANDENSPVDGDVWLVGDTPAGAFATFDENDIALYHVNPETSVGGWHAWAPVEELPLIVANVRKIYVGGSTSEWVDDPSIAGGGGGTWGSITGTLSAQTDLQAALDAKAARSLNLVTEASAFTADPGTHDGTDRMVLCGGDVTFDSAEPYTAGIVFNLYATATIEILVSGVTLTDVSGGTKDLTAGMAISVVMTGATTGIMIGQTVPL